MVRQRFLKFVRAGRLAGGLALAALICAALVSTQAWAHADLVLRIEDLTEQIEQQPDDPVRVASAVWALDYAAALNPALAEDAHGGIEFLHDLRAQERDDVVAEHRHVGLTLDANHLGRM